MQKLPDPLPGAPNFHRIPGYKVYTTGQPTLKVKIMDNIHKYYYLIVFTAYMREMAEVARTTMTDEQKAALTLPGGKTAIPGNQLKLPRTFVDFMGEHAELRGLIDSGKGDLQW